MGAVRWCNSAVWHDGRQDEENGRENKDEREEKWLRFYRVIQNDVIL